MRLAMLISLFGLPVYGLTIKVDYRLDTTGFFDNPQAKAAIEAAAARWSRVVDQKLGPVDLTDLPFGDRRFRMIHPGTGKSPFVLSSAASAATDYFVSVGAPPADEYLGEFTLEEDEWVLFVGARSLGALGVAAGGNISAGINLSTVGTNPESFLNRGFNNGPTSLGVLGGFASFNQDTVWDFDLSKTEIGTGLDFYTVALHEIGHGLGLNAGNVNEWTALIQNGEFKGGKAVQALNVDNDTSVKILQIQDVAGRNYHWKNGTHTSKIFPFGSPNYLGTVGRDGQLQELLMEPRIRLGGPVFRAEITNVDVAALEDIGWSVISEDPPPPPELPLKFSAIKGGGLALGFQSENGASYIIQTSSDAVVWRNVTPFLVGNGERLSWEDGQEGFRDPLGPAAELDGKFYRIVKRSALDLEAPDPG